MRTIFLSAISALILAATVTVLLQRNTSAQQTAASGSIKISNEDLGPEDASVLVSVMKGGAIVKSSDCTSNHLIDWENVAEGDYEVKFEAAGKQTLIKRIHVSSGEATVLSARLPEGKGSFAVGGGPTVAEIDTRLKKVETILARMQPKVHKR